MGYYWGSTELSLPFYINNYISLKKTDEAFIYTGDCPISGVNNSVLVNEKDLSITFKALPIKLDQSSLQKQFDELMEKHHIEERDSFPKSIKSSEVPLSRINEKLHHLEAKILAECSLISEGLMNNKSNFVKFYGDVVIQYHVGAEHRLYNEDAENILAFQNFDLKQILNYESLLLGNKEVDDWNDLACLKSFKHCYMFHDLLCHVRANFQDILLISEITYSYKPDYYFEVNLKKLV